jgi:hypothetical protein
MSRKAWKFHANCVHLFDKSDTFTERKEKDVQSHNRLITDNWIFGHFHGSLVFFSKTQYYGLKRVQKIPVS